VTAIHAQQQPFNNMLKLHFIQKFNSRWAIFKFLFNF
jgi:hypothetical protein